MEGGRIAVVRLKNKNIPLMLGTKCAKVFNRRYPHTDYIPRTALLIESKFLDNLFAILGGSDPDVSRVSEVDFRLFVGAVS